MKNTNWIWRIFVVLLTLVVLAGVGFIGFRIGVAQGANLTDGMPFAFAHGHGFDGGTMHDSFGMRGFDHGRGTFGGRGGFSLFSPIFGLVRLAVLGGLIWLGYTFIKRSGWRVVNVNAKRAPTAVNTEEKKDEA